MQQQQGYNNFNQNKNYQPGFGQGNPNQGYNNYQQQPPPQQFGNSNSYGPNQMQQQQQYQGNYQGNYQGYPPNPNQYPPQQPNQYPPPPNPNAPNFNPMDFLRKS